MPERVYPIAVKNSPLSRLEVLVITSCDKIPVVKPHKIVGLSALALGVGYKVMFKSASLEFYEYERCEAGECADAMQFKMRVRCSYYWKYGLGLGISEASMVLGVVNEPDTFEEDWITTDCQCCLEPPTPPRLERARRLKQFAVNSSLVTALGIALVWRPQQTLDALWWGSLTAAVITLVIFLNRRIGPGDTAPPVPRVRA
jgi:hypothetical protein